MLTKLKMTRFELEDQVRGQAREQTRYNIPVIIRALILLQIEKQIYGQLINPIADLNAY